ncbi:MAG: PQQ-like beta-propeller repeat protein [Saprospiraceae bacterium]|nr:PQQ-like beta-propeller repeat protein [Saprospiraceae bacterium]
MRVKLNSHFNKGLLILIGSLVISCAGDGDARWFQFHGDAHNTGFMNHLTVPATQTTIAWSRPIGSTGFSSPMIGADEIVFVSTVDGKVFGFNPDGALRYSVELGADLKLSSPTYGQDGMIYLTSLRYIAGTEPRQYKSALHVLRPGLKLTLVKSFEFPENTITTAPPKTYRYKNDIYIFSPGYSTLAASILVFKNLSGIIHNEKIYCPGDVENHGDDTWKIILGVISGGLSALVPDLNPNNFEIDGIHLREWTLDPTFAYLEDPEGSLVLVTPFNACGLQAYQWSCESDQLVLLWKKSGLDAVNYGSPGIKLNGETIIGDQDGNIISFHARNGNYFRTLSLGESILSSPAILPGGDIVISGEKHVYLIESNSTFEKADKVFDLSSSTVASPSASSNFIYAAHSNGIFTLDHALSGSFSTFSTSIGGLSSPAISRTGVVYINTANGDLVAFK